MKRLFVILLSVLSLDVYSPASAVAAYNPCQSYLNSLNQAERFVQSTQNSLSREQNNLFNVENQVAFRLSTYQAQAEQAYANYQAAGRSASGYTAGCVARSFFWGGRWGGCAGTIGSGISRRAYAKAQYNSAIARRNSYAVYGQGYIRRQAQRVTQAQARADAAIVNYQRSLSQYQQCEASNGVS